MTDSGPQPTAAPTSGGGAVRAVLVGLAGGAGLFLAWMAANTLFLIFAGLLFAALLDACTLGLGRLLPIGRGWNLAIVCLALAAAVLGVLFWSGYSITSQIDQLMKALGQGLSFLETKMTELGFAPAAASGRGASLAQLLRFLFPNPNQLLGPAQSAFSQALGGIGDAAIVMLVGVFVAADPATYRARILEMLPPRGRHSAAVLLDGTSERLRAWLMGQLAAMLILALLTWIALLALGVPSSFLLGIQTGLLEFIPYLGSVIAALPIFLIALPLGTFTLVAALTLYVIFHMLLGAVLLPLIQKQTLDLPPAVAVASLALFGALFGLMGAVVATPLAIIIRQTVLHFHETR